MYLRFITPRDAFGARGAATGIFGPAYDWRDSDRAPDWLRDALAEEIRWFCDYLPVPERFGVVTRKSPRPYAGVCWFRDGARDSIRHADRLSELLGECGVPVTRIVSDNPGDIVYRDEQQIVAIPRTGSPVRWH